MNTYEKILALITLAGVAVLASNFGVLLPRSREQVTKFRVTRDRLKLHGAPRESSGATAIMNKGCEFVLTRKRSGRWMYALLPSAGGWITPSDLEEYGEHISGPALE